MNIIYDLLIFFHVMSIVFMSVPLFNLIVVNERAVFGPEFNYQVDRYMENIIKNGASRCFMFQSTALVSGFLLLYYGPMGLEAFWTNLLVLGKFMLLFVLTGLLLYVHKSLQPRIESIIADHDSESAVPQKTGSLLKPLRIRRKWMATFCLFLVITIIILGLQLYRPFNIYLNLTLIVMAGLFALRAGKTGNRLGWF